jgi:hypothetical protein
VIRKALIATVAALAAGAGIAAAMDGVSESRSPAPRPGSAAANEAAARADATSLLAKLPLPSGATQSATDPTGDGKALAYPAGGTAATPNAIDDHGWWVVPGSAGAALTYVKAHPPPGSSPGMSGSSSGLSGRFVAMYGFAWPAIAGVLSTRSLVVEVVQLPDGSTGLRADAQDVWITPRAASERIPSGSRILQVSLGHLVDPSRPQLFKVDKRLQRPFTVTSSAKIRRVVALINSLPGGQPGAYSCPMDFGTRVRLGFYARRGARPLAVSVINPAGCQDVQLVLHGRLQPSLTWMAFGGSGRSVKVSLVRQLESAVGRKINAGIP